MIEYFLREFPFRHGVCGATQGICFGIEECGDAECHYFDILSLQEKYQQGYLLQKVGRLAGQFVYGALYWRVVDEEVNQGLRQI